jgi:glycosyltransferase involved in cell wall biosynthesis
LASSDLAFVIPAFNEEKTVAGVVRSLRDFGQVFVVDDGSNDRTSEESSRAGAKVLNLGANSGYDKALAAGLSNAALSGARYVVTCDADGQHLSSDVLKVSKTLMEGGSPIVIGVRPAFARWSEVVFARHARRRHGIYDPLCGLKGYLIESSGHNFEKVFDQSIGTGLAVEYSRLHQAINLPIMEAHRLHGSPKFGSILRSNLRILKALGLCLKRDAILLIWGHDWHKKQGSVA